jgi:hypothetical protein
MLANAAPSDGGDEDDETLLRRRGDALPSWVAQRSLGTKATSRAPTQ